ncbi:MAG: 4Fe-4S binding protein [Desulfobulbaceae bacterium]|nr:4Fe-4S binding protein [Desulfobulbaceae bacterium]
MLPQPLIEKLLSGSTGKIQFETARCLRSRFNKNRCMHCLAVCHGGAIELQGRQIVFDVEKCTNCMQCTAVCPNDAFTGPTDFLADLQLLPKQEEMVLSCKKERHAQNHIAIPCIGSLSEPILASINALAQKDCFIDISQCFECTNGHCRKTLHNNMQNLANKINGKTIIRLKYLSTNQSGLPADPKGTKRSFLKLVGKTIADLGKEAANCKSENLVNPKNRHPKAQMRNAAALHSAFSIMPDERLHEKETLLSYFFSVKANEQCDCCPACTGMCPTGALKRKKENAGKYLSFTSAKCSGCGLCVQFCRKNALTLHSGFAGDPTIRQIISQ